MKPQKHLDARARIAQILGAAMELAPKIGYARLTRDQIADHLHIPSSLIPYHMGTMTEFRRQIMREAIRTECLAVIAQGIVQGDRQAQKAPPSLRARALQSLSK